MSALLQSSKKKTKNMTYGTLSPDLPSLKYGRLMEPKAREAYELVARQRGHKNLQVKECGLFEHLNKIFTGASLNVLVECTCCLKGLLEIKCPRSIATERPTPDNVRLDG